MCKSVFFLSFQSLKTLGKSFRSPWKVLEFYNFCPGSGKSNRPLRSFYLGDIKLKRIKNVFICLLLFCVFICLYHTPPYKGTVHLSFAKFYMHFWKHCQSYSAGFSWSQLIKIHTVFFCFHDNDITPFNCIWLTKKPAFLEYWQPIKTGPRSAVGNVSGYRCVSDCRSGVASWIPARSHIFLDIDHEIISTAILLPSPDSFKKGCCQLQAKVCAQITG